MQAVAAALPSLPAFGTPAGEVARAALAGAGFLLLFAIAESWRRLGNPAVEWTRKLVHFGGGLIAASFPWLFASVWTVMALGGAFFGILWLTRRAGTLQSVHGVSRRSEGGLYFPIAVVVLFVIASGRPVFYLISMLALVVSDAVAAVLGSAYGRLGYEVESDRRTVEGSVVFFLSTFLLAHLPLLLLTDTTPLLSVLVGLQLALLITLFEAISLRGNDNLIVPLVTYFVLIKLTTQQPVFLAYQIAAQLVIMVALAVLAWRYEFLTASGAMAFMLFFYGAYSLGGPEWPVAPAIALIGFTAFYLVRRKGAGAADPRWQVTAAFYVTAIPAALFLANNIFEKVIVGSPLGVGDPFYPTYVGAVAAQVALAAYHIEPRAGRGRRAAATTAVGASIVAFLLVVPAGLAVAVHTRGLDAVLAAAGVVVIASLSHHILRSSRWWPRTAEKWVLRGQAVSVGVGVAITLAWAIRLSR